MNYLYRFLLILVTGILLSVSILGFAKKLEPTKANFLDSIVKQTKLVNSHIRADRSLLIQLNQKVINGVPLTKREQDWLINLATYYHVKMDGFSKQMAWNVLRRRVDVLPVSLVVAQAVYESDWGQSRFAKQGNNYFGLRCYSKNCGLIPKERPDGASFEVRKFSSMQLAVQYYIHTLNTFKHYKKLRSLREEQREANEQLDGMLLAAGLEAYSEQSYYIRAIRSIIKRYRFYQYD